MSHLHGPFTWPFTWPSRQRKVKIALRKLRPAYRHYMEDHDVRSWLDIEYYGKRFEKRMEKDQLFVEPRPKTNWSYQERLGQALRNPRLKVLRQKILTKIRKLKSGRSNSCKIRMKFLLVKIIKRTTIRPSNLNKKHKERYLRRTGILASRVFAICHRTNLLFISFLKIHQMLWNFAQRFFRP